MCHANKACEQQSFLLHLNPLFMAKPPIPAKRCLPSSEPPVPIKGPNLDGAVHGLQLGLCSTQLTGMLLVYDAQGGRKTGHNLVFHVSQLPGSRQVLLQLAGSRQFAIVESHGEGGHGCQQHQAHLPQLAVSCPALRAPAGHKPLLHDISLLMPQLWHSL